MLERGGEDRESRIIDDPPTVDLSGPSVLERGGEMSLLLCALSEFMLWPLLALEKTTLVMSGL